MPPIFDWKIRPGGSWSAKNAQARNSSGSRAFSAPLAILTLSRAIFVSFGMVPGEVMLNALETRSLSARMNSRCRSMR